MQTIIMILLIANILFMCYVIIIVWDSFVVCLAITITGSGRPWNAIHTGHSSKKCNFDRE